MLPRPAGVDVSAHQHRSKPFCLHLDSRGVVDVDSHSSGPCLQATPSLSVGVPMYDSVKLTLSWTTSMAGMIKSRKQS